MMETIQKLIPVIKKARWEKQEAFLRVDHVFIDGREYKSSSYEDCGSVVNM
ncbi:hypothetical protein DPMN_161873 [Dreissena polymorpha]|uniref:Uncharacterized protein n=1 Tax=Dreissena polymorpha TaxID=45954 RepID=A0A9D4EQJ0_DREPO|nr:hypothetical protein DPMN_161873 [Dreissena polymorpha]